MKSSVLLVFAGLHWDQAHSQAQNTSKNDDLENGPLFDLIFVWELILDTYSGLGYAQFGWSIFLNRRLLLKRCEMVEDVHLAMAAQDIHLMAICRTQQTNFILSICR